MNVNMFFTRNRYPIFSAKLIYDFAAKRNSDHTDPFYKYTPALLSFDSGYVRRNLLTVVWGSLPVKM